MPRIRSIDPEMRKSPLLDGMSALTRLVAVYLISEADDEGRMFGDDTSIATACFPRGLPPGVTPEDVGAAVDTLERVGIVVRYEHDAQRYLALRGWRDGRTWCYQVIDRPQQSRLPPPPPGTCPRRKRKLPWRNAASSRVDEHSSSPRRGLDKGREVDRDVDAERKRRGRGHVPDRTRARASPAPSPAGAGSGSARAGKGPAAVCLTAEVRRVIERASKPVTIEDVDAQLLLRLKNAHARLGGDPTIRSDVARAIELHKAGDPEFRAAANQALLAAADAGACVASGDGK